MMFINYLYRINQILKLVCHQDSYNDPQQNPNLLPWVTAGQALQNNALPAINAGQPAPVGYPNHETNGLAEINIQRIQYIRTHGGSRNCLPPHPLKMRKSKTGLKSGSKTTVLSMRFMIWCLTKAPKILHSASSTGMSGSWIGIAVSRPKIGR